MTPVQTADALLSLVVNRLVEAIDPDRIILFGSRARGDHRPQSDLDLLIIGTSDEAPHRRDARAYRAVGAIGVSKDLLWYTPEEIADWKAATNHIVARALREGRVVYEKQT
ncbi:MAG: nucleotidyltransferase domain-containing protein [bacterium]|nr:nucleotidyltransferase domain-containing protein [bacterium]